MPQLVNNIIFPSEGEVASFIYQAKGWPRDFCHRYAKKFIRYYNEREWRKPSGMRMVNWKDTFLESWANLRFDVDIMALQESIRNLEHSGVVIKIVDKKELIGVGTILQEFSLNGDIDNIHLIPYYDSIVESKLFDKLIVPSELYEIKLKYSEQPFSRRAEIVRMFIRKLMMSKSDLPKREGKFKSEVFSRSHSKDILQSFFEYWSESSKGKMRFELQKVFDIDKRLARWRHTNPKKQMTLHQQQMEEIRKAYRPIIDQ